MNAPLAHRASVAHHPAGLNVFAFFHLNLAFSSIEEEQRADVIKRCYWPLLRLAQTFPRLGIELSGYTLEETHRIDPDWVSTARQLIGEGRIELIGSGYSQLIGPLVPARVVAENLAIGNEIYGNLLGTVPHIALVNEQAFSAGLVGHYLDAGYQAILMDWDNPSAHHPGWDPNFQYLPQYAAGLNGQKITVLWTNTTAFQQMQRLIHGDISLEAYLRFLRQRRAASPRALCIYASDAEIFNFRPGRFRTEEKLVENSEWQRWAEALSAIAREPGLELVGPSHALDLLDQEGAGNLLALQSPECPVPVKKQPKYNLARWAVSGRDNTAINAACQRIYQGMSRRDAERPDWKELCYLWSSDFRTHLTERRWATFCARLKTAEAKWSHTNTFSVLPAGEAVEERYIEIATPTLTAKLDRRRGLAIERLRFDKNDRPIIGGLPHSYFGEIALQADWYTGDSVFEAPGEHKVTDLEWCQTNLHRLPSGDLVTKGLIATPKGLIEKQMLFSAKERRVDFDIVFHWADWGKGILRLGHFTLLPEAFALEKLSLATSNGGGVEAYALEQHTINHGAPVSALVSSSHGFGMSEGWAELGDDRTRFRIEVDRAVAPLVGLLTHRPATRSDGSRAVFCQLQLSALELDDTRKPASYIEGPKRFRFSVLTA